MSTAKERIEQYLNVLFKGEKKEISEEDAEILEKMLKEKLKRIQTDYSVRKVQKRYDGGAS